MTAWSQTASGRRFVFAFPIVEPVHLFTEVTPQLARSSRFAGATQLPISIAQHSLEMAEEAERDTGDPELAAFCLLHDAHETWLGDWTSPAVAAVEETIHATTEEAGCAAIIAASRAAHFRLALTTLKMRIDRVVFAAAGLDHQRYRARADEVRLYDLQALATERRDLMGPPPVAWDIDTIPDLLPPRKRRVKPLAWPDAEERFKAALTRLCPEAARAAALAA